MMTLGVIQNQVISLYDILRILWCVIVWCGAITPCYVVQMASNRSFFSHSVMGYLVDSEYYASERVVNT